MSKADVLVVGAGSAGNAIAGNLALAGLDVLVVDKRGPDEAGARWLNAVPPWCFDEAGLARPAAPERWGAEHGASFVTAVGAERSVRIEAPEPVHVDMRALVSRLRARASDAGARYVQGAVSDVQGARRVERVRVEGHGEVRARLIVDASGMGGAVRKRVAAMQPRWAPVHAHDTCAAAQYQYAVRDPEGLRSFLARYGATPGDGLAILGVAGGFSTLTLFTEPSCREVGVLTGSIPSLGAPSGAAVLERFVARAAFVGRRLYGGRGAIPLRRPYGVLGANGVALVGDAAAQVYSSHGSGVGMGLIAARILADAVIGAADPGADATLDAYTRAFHRRHGALLTGADAFRRVSQGLDPKTIASLLDRELLDAHALASGLAQKPPQVEAAWALGQATRALRSPREAAAVAPALLRMGALEALGRWVPKPRGLRGRVVDAMRAALVGGSALPAHDIAHVDVDVASTGRGVVGATAR